MSHILKRFENRHLQGISDKMISSRKEVRSWVHVEAKISAVQSIAQLCLTLCNPMDFSTPGLPVHHHLLQFVQTHVHRVGDAIQPSHSLSSFSRLQSSPASGSFPMSQLFSSAGQSTGASASTSNKCSGLISFRID